MDLFVRVSNETAISMYKRLGYVVYRRIIEYYSGDGVRSDEDAFGEELKNLNCKTQGILVLCSINRN